MGALSAHLGIELAPESRGVRGTQQGRQKGQDREPRHRAEAGERREDEAGHKTHIFKIHGVGSADTGCTTSSLVF